jgi:rubrerythrin
MKGTFNAGEIFEMAMEIERNGAKFYRKAAEGKAGQTSKGLLLRLADMEVQHERTFAAMRDMLTTVETTSATFDPDDEAVLYLQAIADGHVFNAKVDPSALLTGKESAADILKTAIGLEKDSIVFYLGIQDLVAKSLGRERIGHIIREEMTHVTLLSAELKKVS